MKMLQKIKVCKSLENSKENVYFNLEFILVKLQVYNVKASSPQGLSQKEYFEQKVYDVYGVPAF